MVAVRIPGAEQIDNVAPARDPGVQASPEDFGANIGASLTHLGDSAGTLGATLNSLNEHLIAKRQGAEDQVYVQTHEISRAPAIQQAIIDNRKAYPDGGPGTMEDLNTRLQAANDGVTAGLADRGFKPSKEASAHVATQFAGQQGNALVSGVAYDNNAQVKKLQDASGDNVKSVASQVQDGSLSLDDGIKQVGSVVQSGKTVYGGDALRTFEETSQKLVVNAAIENKMRVGDNAGAQAIRDKYYGHTPVKGEGNAGAVAATAENLGVAPRDLAAVISYETGGKMDPGQWGGKGGNYLGLIQFGPEERVKYGVRPGMTFAEQMPAVENYLRDRGVKPGMGVAEIYSIVNAGSLDARGQPRWNASDGNGTVASHIDNIQKNHYPAADRFLAGASKTTEGDGALLPDPALSLHWQKQFEAQKQDIVRADAIQKIQAQKVSDDAEGAYLKDLFSDKPTTTVRQIVNDDTLKRDAKERMIGVANRALKDDPLAQRSQQATMGLITRMRLPDGNPDRITNTDPIYKEYTDGNMTRADFEFSIKQFNENTGATDGSNTAKMRANFVKQAGDAISLANISSSLTGGDGTFKKYEFEQYVSKRVDDMRAAKKDPSALFDPNSSDYLGKLDSNGRVAILKPFLPNQQDDARTKAASIPAPPVATNSPQERQRLDDWLRARGGGFPAAAPPTATPLIPVSQ